MVKWDDELWIFTIDEYNQIPDGTPLQSIMGSEFVKGKDYIDMDTRGGHIAYGVRNPANHCLAELFTRFKLMQ